MLYKLKNVSKNYKLPSGEVLALKDISLDINEKGFLCIMGPSGSGKTTLMNLLGFLDLPSSGELFFKQKDIKNLGDEELTRIRKEEIGFVFQQYNLIASLNALENVELPMILRRLDKEKIRNRALELLTSVGIPLETVYHRPMELSGGEQQRVAIARALANDPAILLADEPTGNVDSHTTEEIMRLFRKINNSGKEVIVVTHDSLVAKYAKKKLRIIDGRIENGKRS
jgi:putative ABC transport system ATP-binding protein